MQSDRKEKTIMRRTGFAALVCLVLGFAVIGIPGCDREGPAERAGERLDDALDDVGDAVEDVADEAEEAADEAQDALDDAAEEIGQQAR